MQQLKVFLKEAAHQELLPTIRRFVDILFVFTYVLMCDFKQLHLRCFLCIIEMLSLAVTQTT